MFMIFDYVMLYVYGTINRALQGIRYLTVTIHIFCLSPETT
jgi:hypothetical protein